MRSWPARVLLITMVALAVSCGGGKPKAKDGKGADKGAAGATDGGKGGAGEGAATEPAVLSAQDRIKQWLGNVVTEKIGALGEQLGKDLGEQLAKDEAVLKEADTLTKAVLKDKDVKKEMDKIADKATEGAWNKLTLAWKALRSGGVDAYKKKVKESTSAIANEVISDHLKNGVLKDPRMAETMKKFIPVLQLQAKVTAVAVEENLSPKVSKKILGIALRLAAAGESAESSAKVESWIEGCDTHVQVEVEKLLTGVAGLETVDGAVRDLTIAVLKHATTKREVTAMVTNLTKDKDVRAAMTKAYENAAFEKGDKAVRASIEKIVALPKVDDELFATLGRLAEAAGAAGIMEQHLSKVSEDPALAQLVDDFVVGLLDTCGDPTK